MKKIFMMVLAVGCGAVACATAQGSRGSATTSSVEQVRTELARLYQVNADAFRRYDVPGVMALRAPDFHTVAADGTARDRAGMEQYTIGLMNGIKKWNELTFTIDSLTLVGDTAIAIVSQHLDRMALRPDNQVHHVETWVTQRETWIKSKSSWLMWRVDQLRNQRRLVDGTAQ